MRKLFLLLVVLVSLLPAGNVWCQTNASYTRIEDVVYGRKFGMALTLDVFQPPKGKANGIGIILIVSGGWFSAHEAINMKFVGPLVKRGYTVFAVMHGSQPRFIVTEIEPDIHRAVRFIRHNAAKYGVDPNRLGLTGGSAGGHLSLTMATQGEPGVKDAKDPVERESSEVQCVACFFPPTDFLNYGEPGEDAVGVGTLANFKSAFGPMADTPEGRQQLGKLISPIYFVHSNMPPILIIHGDADKLVPLYQSQCFVKKCDAVGSPVKLVVREGKAHGWPDLTKDIDLFGVWFDNNLLHVKANELRK